MERASVLFSTCYIGRYKQLTYLRHVETGVFFADVLDDQFPLTGADVLDRNARIVRHHNQVDGLDGFGVGFHPTDLLSSVHRPDNSPPPTSSQHHTDATNEIKTVGKQKKIVLDQKDTLFLRSYCQRKKTKCPMFRIEQQHTINAF